MAGFFFKQVAVTPRLTLIATLILTLVVYWIGLHGPLVFDDAQNLAPITQWLQGKTGWTSVVFGNHSGTFGRPVSMASFVLNVALLGPEVWALKLGNLLLHLLNGSLVYLLFSGLLQQQALIRDPPATNRWLPLLGAALWLLHPLFVSTVLYVVQRMAMLSALFTLLAMLAYLHGRIALVAGRRQKAWTLLTLAVPLSTVLATLSKENGILAPALCAVIELSVFLPRPGERRAWPSTLVVVVGLVVPAMIAIAFTAIQHPAIVGGYANRPFTLIERLLTQPRVLWDYIGSLLLPYGPRLGLYHDDYPISHGLFDPPATALALLGWAVTLIAAWRLRRRVPGFTLGMGIFLVGQALESSVFPLLMYFEHRNYLPAVGAIWALLSLAAFAAAHLRQKMHQPARVFAAGGIALVLVLALATAARAGIWQTQRSLLAQGLQYHPDSRWLRMDLIAQAMTQRPPRVSEALQHANHMLASSDASIQRLGAVSRLMVECSAIGSTPQQFIMTAFAGRPEPVEPDLLIAFESLSEGVMQQPCRGLPPVQMAIRLSAMLDRTALSADNPSVWRLRLKAAKLFLAGGRSDEALQQARLGYANGAADAPVPVFIAELLLQRDDPAGAARMLDAAEQKMAKDDVSGHDLVAQYRAEIQRRTH